MKKLLMKVKDNYKMFICYGFIGAGLLLLVGVLIIQPRKKVVDNLYTVDDDIVIEEREFPIVEKVKIDVDYLSGLWLYLDDYSINDYDYDIEVVDDNNKSYFKEKYRDYGSNIIYLNFGVMEKSLDKELDVIINCLDCHDVEVATVNKEDGTKMLKLAKEYYVKNNIYYWHAFMAIAIGIILLPLSKEAK